MGEKSKKRVVNIHVTYVTLYELKKKMPKSTSNPLK